MNILRYATIPIRTLPTSYWIIVLRKVGKLIRSSGTKLKKQISEFDKAIRSKLFQSVSDKLRANAPFVVINGKQFVSDDKSTLFLLISLVINSKRGSKSFS